MCSASAAPAGMQSAEKKSGHTCRDHTLHAITVFYHADFKLTEFYTEIIPDDSDEIQQPVPPVEFTSASPEAQSRNVIGTDTGSH